MRWANNKNNLFHSIRTYCLKEKQRPSFTPMIKLCRKGEKQIANCKLKETLASQVKSRSSSLFSVFSVLNSYFLCIHSKWTNHYDHTLPKVAERYRKILQRDKCMSVKPSKRLIFHNQLYTSLLRSQLLQMLLSCFSMYCWFLLDIQVLPLSTYSTRWANLNIHLSWVFKNCSRCTYQRKMCPLG